MASHIKALRHYQKRDTQGNPVPARKQVACYDYTDGGGRLLHDPQSGRLLIDPDTCPNLAAEGSLYAYDPDEGLVTETRLTGIITP
jgi:hypothetical protein